MEGIINIICGRRTDDIVAGACLSALLESLRPSGSNTEVTNDFLMSDERNKVSEMLLQGSFAKRTDLVVGLPLDAPVFDKVMRKEPLDYFGYKIPRLWDNHIRSLRYRDGGYRNVSATSGESLTSQVLIWFKQLFEQLSPSPEAVSLLESMSGIPPLIEKNINLAGCDPREASRLNVLSYVYSPAYIYSKIRKNGDPSAALHDLMDSPAADNYIKQQKKRIESLMKSVRSTEHGAKAAILAGRKFSECDLDNLTLAWLITRKNCRLFAVVREASPIGGLIRMSFRGTKGNSGESAYKLQEEIRTGQIKGASAAVVIEETRTRSELFFRAGPTFKFADLIKKFSQLFGEIQTNQKEG